jgi:hypothetical protein
VNKPLPHIRILDVNYMLPGLISDDADHNRGPRASEAAI